MSEDTDRQVHPEGRVVAVFVTGDNAGELEMAALDKGREFFGPVWRLTIVPSYNAYPAAESTFEWVKASGKIYCAGISVRIIEAE